MPSRTAACVTAGWLTKRYKARKSAGRDSFSGRVPAGCATRRLAKATKRRVRAWLPSAAEPNCSLPNVNEVVVGTDIEVRHDKCNNHGKLRRYPIVST